MWADLFAGLSSSNESKHKMISQNLSHCLFLILDFILFIGQLSHCPLLLFWYKFLCACVFVVVGGRDDRQHRLPWSFPAQRFGNFPPQNLPALHPATSPRQRHHPGYAAHAHQQQFKGMAYMCACVIEPQGPYMNSVVWVVRGLRAQIDRKWLQQNTEVSGFSEQVCCIYWLLWCSLFMVGKTIHSFSNSLKLISVTLRQSWCLGKRNRISSLDYNTVKCRLFAFIYFIYYIPG